MTTTQHQQQLQDMRDIQEFEIQVGLEKSFALWYDRRLKTLLMYVSTHVLEKIGRDSDNKKVIAREMVIDVRYIGGRMRSITKEAWEAEIKAGGKVVRRFVQWEIPDNFEV